MSERHHIIPVWFFVGVLLFVYGILILNSGIQDWSVTSSVVLAEYHAPVWWGGVLIIVGAVYTYAFWPGRSKGGR